MVGKSKLRRVIDGIGLYAAVLAYVLFAVFPIYWTVKISVTPQSLLYSEGIKLWPSAMTLDNYRSVLAASDFPRYFANSVIVSVATSLIVTVVASLSGYALSRFRFRGKTWVSLLLLYYFAVWPPLIGLCWLLWVLLCLAQPRFGLGAAAMLLPFYFQHKDLYLVDAVLAIPPAAAATACLLPAVVRHAWRRRHWFAHVDAAALGLLAVSLLAAARVWQWDAYRQGMIDLVLVPLALWFAFRILDDGVWGQTAGEFSYTIALALFAGGVLAAAWGVAAWIGGHGVDVDGVRRLVGPHFSPNHTALYLVRTFFLGVGLAATWCAGGGTATHIWLRWGRFALWGATALVLLAATSVGREGLETVLFLFAGSTTDSGTTYILGGVLGFAAAAAIGAAIYAGTNRFPMKMFFQVSGIVIIFIAAGMLATSVVKLYEAAIISDLGSRPWDTESFISITSNLGKFLNTLVGYDSAPSTLQIGLYWSYLLLALSAFLFLPLGKKPAPKPGVVPTEPTTLATER